MRRQPHTQIAMRAKCTRKRTSGTIQWEWGWEEKCQVRVQKANATSRQEPPLRPSRFHQVCIALALRMTARALVGPHGFIATPSRPSQLKATATGACVRKETITDTDALDRGRYRIFFRSPSILLFSMANLRTVCVSRQPGDDCFACARRCRRTSRPPRR